MKAKETFLTKAIYRDSMNRKRIVSQIRGNTPQNGTVVKVNNKKYRITSGSLKSTHERVANFKEKLRNEHRPK